MNNYNKEPSLSNLTFLGSPSGITTKRQLDSYNTFQNFDLLNSLKNKVKYELDKVLKKNNVFESKKKKLLFTERDFGIFNFDKASQGLFKVKVDGVEKVVTSEKKIYTIFENKSSNKKSISIYCYAGGVSNVSANNMLYTGISATLLAQKLLELGYNIEFKTIVATQYNNRIYGSLITIKEFNNNFSENSCMLSTSDPTFFRWNGFKNFISVSDYFNSDIPNGLGSIATTNFKKVFDELDKIQGVKKTNIVLGVSYSELSAINSITEILNNL